MAEISFKVETPKNLDSIFSLECFHFLEMKGVFKNIYEYLKMFGLKIEDIESKLSSIPDFSKLMKTLEDLQKQVNDIGKSDKELRKDFEANKVVVTDKFKSVELDFNGKHDGLDIRILKLEEEVLLLMNRPVSEGNNVAIDYSLLCMKTEYNDLVNRMKLVEKRNHEQDDRLTNNELRIEKLEKMINDPLDRIMALEQAVSNIHLELNNRVTVQDLYNEMLKKADINGLKALEASLIRLNDIVNDLAN